jgi:hypothetical protein
MKTPEQPADPLDNVLPAGPPVATADEYEVFGLWMNVQLSQLVARWSHLAAPKAAQTEFATSRRFSKPRKAK